MFYDDDEVERYHASTAALTDWIHSRPALRVYDAADLTPGSDVYVTFDTASQKNMYKCLPRWGRVQATGRSFEDVLIRTPGASQDTSLVGHYWGCKGVDCNIYLIHDPV